jgi:selenocysteine-specific translation elongation factor
MRLPQKTLSTPDRIKIGEEIQILPEEITSRIRGIQVHNQPVEEAVAGQRTAINLQGMEKSAIKRGDVLARPETIRPSQRLDVFDGYRIEKRSQSLPVVTLFPLPFLLPRKNQCTKV